MHKRDYSHSCQETTLFPNQEHGEDKVAGDLSCRGLWWWEGFSSALVSHSRVTLCSRKCLGLGVSNLPGACCWNSTLQSSVPSAYLDIYRAFSPQDHVGWRIEHLYSTQLKKPEFLSLPEVLYHIWLLS